MKEHSTIPAVLKALVALVKLTIVADDFAVTDGQPIPPIDGTPNIICIGFTGVPGDEAIINNRTRQQMTLDPDRESYQITCVASSWAGHEQNMTTVRETAYGLVDILNRQLMLDQTLNGLVMRARIFSDSLAEEQTSMGAVSTVRFIIAVEAHTR